MSTEHRPLLAAELVSRARQYIAENQTDFGARFGKSQSLMSKYERGEVEPPAHIIIHSMTIVEENENQERWASEQLALDIKELGNHSRTLPLRRAIRDLLELGKALTYHQ